jgi:hypothetical protein
MVDLSELVTASEAAIMLDVSSETVRKYLLAGKLSGQRNDSGRWYAKRASVEAHLAMFGQSTRPHISNHRELAAEVRRLAEAVDRLERRETGSSEDRAALARERDRYRADASTMRETALQLNAAAQEAGGALRQVLAVLEHQSAALSQLLTPGLPQDLQAEL